MIKFEASTAIVRLLCRIHCTFTSDDYAEVHALQDKFKLQPLSTWGTNYVPPPGTIDPAIDMKTSINDQVNRLTIVEFLTLLADLMIRNPPRPWDARELTRFKSIGLESGKRFDGMLIDPHYQELLPVWNGNSLLPVSAQFMMNSHAIKFSNWWFFPTGAGQRSTNYIDRASIADYLLCAELEEDVIYYFSSRGSIDEPLYDGAYKYEMRFEEMQLPRIRGSWSFTMYDEAFNFVENPINRHSISPLTSPKFDSDKSLPIYIQNDNPGPDKRANWLPAPKERFNLVLRLYWPLVVRDMPHVSKI